MAITEKQVKKLIKEETQTLQECLDQFSKDFKAMKKSQERVERVLLGDKEYDDKGMAYMVNYSYEYTRKNTESDIIDRVEKVIKRVVKYEDNGYWIIFEEIVGKYKAIKWFASLTITGGLIGTANIVYMILKLFID